MYNSLAMLRYNSMGGIALSVVYTEIYVQPCAISGGKYLAGLKILFYLCCWKEVHSQQGLMPAHALLMATDDIFRWIVNFFEQSFVRKVAVANFATIAECYIISAVTVAPLSAADINHSPRAGWLSMSRPQRVGLNAQHPEVCAWTSQPDAQYLANKSVCGYLPEPYTDTGAYIQVWHLWRLSTYLHHTHPIADNVSRRREIVQIWKSRKILLSLCNDWRQRTPEATRSALQTGTGTMLSDGCHARYWHCNNNNEIPDQKTGLRIRNHYEKPAVECGTNRNGLTRQNSH